MSVDTVKFSLRDRVYLRVNAGEVGIVTGILFRESGVLYGVTFGGGSERWHYGFELTTDKAEAESPV